MYDKKGIKTRKVLSIIVQTIILSAVVYIFGMLVGKIEVSSYNIVKCLKKAFFSPFKSYWFISTYLFYYMLIPIMQLVVQNLHQKFSPFMYNIDHISTIHFRYL